MGHTKQIVIKGQTVIIADYSFFKEEEMITQAQQIIESIKQNKRPALILNFFNDCYITEKFANHIKKAAVEGNLGIKKQALLGLNQPKKTILKGFNLFFNRDYQAFDTLKEAIEYLIEAEVSDSEIEAFQNQKNT